MSPFIASVILYYVEMDLSRFPCLITSNRDRLLLTDAGHDRHVDVLFDMRPVRKCINSTVVNLEIVVESNVR